MGVGISVCFGETSTDLKNKKCISCGREDQPHFSKKRCKACSQKDYAKKAQDKAFTISSSPKKKTASKIVKKASGEKVLFESIWATRPHYSFISGLPLDEQPKVHYFAHVISKGLYPKFKLLDRNIVLLTEDEHYLFDFGTQKQRDEYVIFMLLNHRIVVDWNKLFKLVEELKLEYHENN